MTLAMPLAMNPIHGRGAQQGFVLIIMLLVLVLGSAYFLLVELNNTNLHLQTQADTTRQTAHIMEALLGFALVNKRLPCVAGNGNTGVENCALTGEAYLPWATLGIDAKDSWGRPMRYRVDSNYTVAVTSAPLSVGSFTVRNLVGSTLSQTGINSPPAVVFSCGLDGKPNSGNDANGAPNANGLCDNPGPAVSAYVQDAIVADTFDDIVLWLPRNTLVSRMTAAGKW